MMTAATRLELGCLIEAFVDDALASRDFRSLSFGVDDSGLSVSIVVTTGDNREIDVESQADERATSELVTIVRKALIELKEELEVTE
jgi:hypothetical protein